MSEGVAHLLSPLNILICHDGSGPMTLYPSKVGHATPSQLSWTFVLATHLRKKWSARDTMLGVVSLNARVILNALIVLD